MAYLAPFLCKLRDHQTGMLRILVILLKKNSEKFFPPEICRHSRSICIFFLLNLSVPKSVYRKPLSFVMVSLVAMYNQLFVLEKKRIIKVCTYFSNLNIMEFECRGADRWHLAKIHIS